MDPVGDHERIRDKRFRGKHRANVVIGIIVHHVVRCYEHRDISAGLGRKKIIYGPEIVLCGISSGASDSFVDCAGTAVICSYGECPVIICVVEVFKIFGSLF